MKYATIALILDALLRFEQAGRDNVTAAQLARVLEMGYGIPPMHLVLLGATLETQGILTKDADGIVALTDTGREHAKACARLLDEQEREQADN